MKLPSENVDDILMKQKMNTTPKKLDLKPVLLQDILVLPKTPKREGRKNTEKVPFVLTSAEWQNRETKKLAKEEKEEAIKKRKEESEH